jgi:DNA polymerase
MQEKEKSVDPAERLQKLKDLCLRCGNCSLCRTRKNVVFGEGDSSAQIMFIGEGPGREEDACGRPFVGASGKLLRKMIDAIELDSQDYYIANIVKCRPPMNRNPEPEEIENCVKFLKKQIEIIDPGLLVLLGRTAIRGILPDNGEEPIRALGDVCRDFGALRYNTIPVIVTYHPSALLRSSKYKNRAREDFLYIQALYREMKELVSNDLLI